MNGDELYYLIYLIQNQKADENFFNSIYKDEEKLRFLIPVLQSIKEETHLYTEYRYASILEFNCKLCLKTICENYS